MAMRLPIKRLGFQPIMERMGGVSRYFSNGVLIGRTLNEEERAAANIYTQIIKKREEKGKPKNKEEKDKLKKKEEMEKEESEKKKYRRITQRCDSDRSWFSDNYYDKLVYQDVNLRSYFSSVRPPTKQTYGFRLGKCTIHHFPKRTSLHVFLPRRPQRMSNRSRPENANTWWWQLEKVGKLGFLQRTPDTEEQTK